MPLPKSRVRKALLTNLSRKRLGRGAEALAFVDCVAFLQLVAERAKEEASSESSKRIKRAHVKKAVAHAAALLGVGRPER